MSIQTQDLTNDVRSGIRTLWWLFLLRGVFGVVFGVLALVNGEAAVELLAWILGLYIILDGALTIIASIAQRKRLGSVGWYVFQGALSVLVGIAILSFSSAFATVVGLIIIWAIILIALIAGLAGLRLSFAAKGVTKTWGWGILGNTITLIVAVLLAVLVFTNPDGLLRVLLVVIGIWSLLVGLALIIWSFVARKFINEAFKSLSVTQTTISN
jgi:uncharacterized membrane protein HdeD (DUF308 family)